MFSWYEVEDGTPELATTTTTTTTTTSTTTATTTTRTITYGPPTAENITEKYCAGAITDMNCCNETSRCGYSSGDCDVDDHCSGDLRCGLDNCQMFRSWADPKADCCVEAWQLENNNNNAEEATTTVPPEPDAEAEATRTFTAASTI